MQVQKPRKGYKLIKSLFGKYDEIPEEWEYVALNNLTPRNEKSAIRMGPFGSSLKIHELLDSGEIKTLWIENIVNDEFSFEYQKFITEEKFEQLKGFIVKPDDIIITMMGTLGKVAIVPHNIGTAIISSHLLKITLDQKKALPIFLYYFLKSNFVLRQIIKESRGIVMGGLNTGIIKNLMIKNPPKPEQQKIASILSNVDSLIQQTQKEIEQTQRLKKGLMQRLLTKGIGHKKFKKVKSLFGKYEEIPEEWNLEKLDQITSKITDIDHKMPKKVSDGIPFLSIGYLVRNSSILLRLDHKNDILEYISAEDYNFHSKKFNAEKGDLLYTRFGSIGHAKVIDTDDKLIASYSVVLIKPKKSEVDSLFLAYSLNGVNLRKQAKLFTQGSSNQNLHLSDIKGLKLSLPPLNEQQKIASILSNVDSKIQKQQEYKERLESLKKGLMQKLLTGKIRVKV